MRFRITKSDDPASFPDGSDLLTREGMPWKVSIAELRKGVSTSCQQLLLRDKLVPENAFEAHHKRSRHDTISSFGESFFFDFSSYIRRMHIQGDHRTEVIRVWNFLRYKSRPALPVFAGA